MKKEITEAELFNLERRVLNLSFRDKHLSQDVGEIEQEATKLFGSGDIVKKKIDLLKEVLSKKDYSEFKIIQLKFNSSIKSLYVQHNMGFLSGLLKNVKRVELKNKTSKDIFIVHGYNDKMKKESSDFLIELNLNPIILHQQPNRNRTIIKKFSDYANIVNFAVILLSADDFGYKKSDNPDKAILRARQNVIFELGYFIGKIGQENVFVLLEDSKNFEILSDYHGVLYTPFDKKGKWKKALKTELIESGYKI